MTNIVLPPVTNGNNISTLNDNFRKIQESVNNDLLNLDGGNNVMQQDLDMNGNQLLNIGVDVNDPQSLLTVAAGDSRYYNVSGDTLTGPMSVNGQVISGLAAAIASTSPVRKSEFDAAVFETASALEARLADPDVGDALIGVKQPFTGAVARTQHDKNTDRVSVLDFGAKCDALTLGTDDTEAIKAAIAAVLSLGGGEVFIPGLSIITESILVPGGVTLRGSGKGYEKRPIAGLIARGTGAKDYTVNDATAISVANPDVGAAYLADSGTRGDTYQTLDLTIPFSAAVVLGKGAGLKDLGIIPWFNGVAGYAGGTGGLSDDWDVGVWCRNASGWQIENVISDGHWRKAGLLVSSSIIGDAQTPQCELGMALNCSFGGFRGVAIRAPRNATGATNFGFAGTDFINCFIRSLNHQSLSLATSSFLTVPFPSPSAALELDGSTVLRGVQFLNCTFMGRDDISVISDFSSETLFSGCYEESKAIRVSGIFIADAIGSRMVATANTDGFFWHSNTKYAVDFSPYFTKDSSLTTSRYTFATPGVFSPATAQDSEWERPNFATSYGIRLRAGQVFRLYDSGFNNPFRVTETGATFASGNITIEQDAAGLYSQSTSFPLIRRFGSGTVQVGSGAAVLSDNTLTTPGIVRHTTDNVSSFGTVSFRAASTFTRQVFVGAGAQLITGGTNTPEGAITAPVGSLFLRSNGGAVTTLYIKETGVGNTGWVAK